VLLLRAMEAISSSTSWSVAMRSNFWVFALVPQLLHLQVLIDEGADRLALDFGQVLVRGLDAGGDDQQPHALDDVIGGNQIVVNRHHDAFREALGRPLGGGRLRDGAGASVNTGGAEIAGGGAAGGASWAGAEVDAMATNAMAAARVKRPRILLLEHRHGEIVMNGSPPLGGGFASLASALSCIAQCGER